MFGSRNERITIKSYEARSMEGCWRHCPVADFGELSRVEAASPVRGDYS
jgi:hypothetical protein